MRQAPNPSTGRAARETVPAVAVASGDVELGVALLSNVDKRDRFGHDWD